VAVLVEQNPCPERVSVTAGLPLPDAVLARRRGPRLCRQSSCHRHGR
jgi:hypothetical protein